MKVDAKEQKMKEWIQEVLAKGLSSHSVFPEARECEAGYFVVAVVHC